MPPNEILSSTSLETELSMAVTSGGKGGQSKKIQQEMIEFIERLPQEPIDPTLVVGQSPDNDELAPLVRSMAMAADLRKADNIVAMRVSKITSLCSFILICTGNSRPKNQAISAAITDAVVENFSEFVMRGNGVPEGNADSGWILLDYGDVMVHIMTPKSRLFYDIEGQWKKKGGEYLNLDDVLLPDSVSEESVNSQMLGVSEDDDPFWS